MNRMHQCHRQHVPFISGEIAPVYSKSEIKLLCTMERFDDCIMEVMGNCSAPQLLKIEGIQEAIDWICHDDGLDDYKGHYMNFGLPIVLDENEICKEKFLIGAEHYLREYMHLDSLDSPESEEEKDERSADISDEKDACCGYWYAYVHCQEDLVDRHVDKDLVDYQYDVLSHYYEPQFEECGCKVGKGISMIFINAMIIVGCLLVFILGLATTCGCIDCCGLKVKQCRRSCRQMCYCCYDFEEDEEYFERKYEAKLHSLYGEDNEAFDSNRKSYNA